MRSGIVIFVFCVSSLLPKPYFPEKTGKEFYYFDGTEKKKVYLVENMFMEFFPSGYDVKKIDRNLEIYRETSSARIYKTGNKNMIEKIKKMELSKEYPRLSEVFLSEEGALMGLPGGIILQFHKHVTEDQKTNFLKKHNFTVKKTWKWNGEEYYVVDSPAGLQTLITVNALHGHPYLKRAEPDWWVDLRSR